MPGATKRKNSLLATGNKKGFQISESLFCMVVSLGLEPGTPDYG